MMCLLNSFRVPGIDHIQIYPDDENPYRFYYFNVEPQLAVDYKTKLPMLSYLLIAFKPEYVMARDKVDYESAELERGAFTMTTVLGLSSEEETAIRTYLMEQKLSEKSYLGFLERILPKAFANLQKKTENRIILSPADATDGNCSLELSGDTGDGSVVKYVSRNVKPSLNGDFRASFIATLGREGAQLMWMALHSDEEGSGRKRVSGATHTLVRYSLTGHAVIPALDIEVIATGADVYTYLKNQVGDENPSVAKDGKTVLSKESIDEIMHSADFLSSVVKVKMMDMDGYLPPEQKQANMDLANTLVSSTTEQIISELFQEIPGIDYLADRETETTEENGDGGKTTYYVLANKTEEQLKHFFYKLSVKKNTVIPINLYAQGNVFYSMTKAQMDRLIKICNLTNAGVMYRDVPINCYARFEKDQIEAIHVNVEFSPSNPKYDAYSTDEQFKFEPDKKQAMFYYNYPVSASKDCPDIETLRYQTGIVYSGEKVKWSEMFETDKNQIIISYESLGYLDLTCNAFGVDWDVVSEVVVKIRYLGAEDKPTSSTEIHLKEDERTAQWSCFKYGSDSNEYAYSVDYYNRDFTEAHLPEQRGVASSLFIEDMLEGVVSASFVVGFDQDDVSQVDLFVSHAGIIDTYTFNSPGVYNWSRRLMKGESKEFTYRYIVRYANSPAEELPWSEPVTDPTQVQPLTVNRSDKTLLLMSGGFPWADWPQAIVQVEYPDGNNVISDVYPMSEAEPKVQIKIKARDRSKKFRCTVVLIDNSGEPHTLPSEEADFVFNLKAPAKEAE